MELKTKIIFQRDFIFINQHLFQIIILTSITELELHCCKKSLKDIVKNTSLSLQKFSQIISNATFGVSSTED